MEGRERVGNARQEGVMVDMGVLVGTMRRFGLVGPAYEVLGPVGAEGVEPLMRVHVLESGDEFDCPVRDIMSDPVED
jgi:hypothetical protein